MPLTIKPATRQGFKPLIGLYAESGCGKTYSALLLARGLSGPSGNITMIDTEGGRGSLYADVIPGGYNVLDMGEPFRPQRFVEAITTVEQSRADVLVIDSISHAWEGIGGVLEWASQNEADGKKGRLIWKEPKMEHERMVGKLLQTRLPIVCCMRAKHLLIEVTKAGRKEMVKDPNATPKQADDFIFIMTVHAEILQDHSLRMTKVSHPTLRACFPDKGPITITHGELLAAWCKSPGASPAPTPKAGGSPTTAASPPTAGTVEQRYKMFDAFREAGIDHETLRSFADQNALLMPTEELGDWPLSKVPTTMKQMTALIQQVNDWKAGVAV